MGRTLPAFRGFASEAELREWLAQRHVNADNLMAQQRVSPAHLYIPLDICTYVASRVVTGRLHG